MQTHSATQLFGPERRREPLTSDGRGLSLSDRPPAPGGGAPAAAPSRSRPNGRHRQKPGTDRVAANTPQPLPSAGSAGEAEPPRRERPAWRRAGLTRSTCLEPAGRQQQAAAAAQRHGEPVPATASGGGHLRAAQGHLGAAILARPAPSAGSWPRQDFRTAVDDVTRKRRLPFPAPRVAAGRGPLLLKAKSLILRCRLRICRSRIRHKGRRGGRGPCGAAHPAPRPPQGCPELLQTPHRPARRALATGQPAAATCPPPTPLPRP